MQLLKTRKTALGEKVVEMPVWLFMILAIIALGAFIASFGYLAYKIF